MNAALPALYELQLVDSALALATKQLKALDKGDRELAAAETARAAHASAATLLHETSGNLKDSELELQTVEKKRSDFEGKLYSGKVSAPKELSAMQEEIEALGRQRGRLDERILTYLEEIETRRADEASTKAALDLAEAALAKKLKEYKSAANALTKRIKALTAERTAKAAEIAAPLLKRYEAIRAPKLGVGIGRVDDAVCGACHTNLPSNLIRRLRDAEGLELCENCGRILFLA